MQPLHACTYWENHCRLIERIRIEIEDGKVLEHVTPEAGGGGWLLMLTIGSGAGAPLLRTASLYFLELTAAR